MSDYKSWSAKEHADKWLLFAKNIGPRLCIDETSMSNGELYTIISNPDARGKKGTLVAMIEGVKSDDIIAIINKIPEKHRRLVKEVTLDMSNSMNRILGQSRRFFIFLFHFTISYKRFLNLSQK